METATTYVFFKYLLNHHLTKISLVINLKVLHPRMMIKVQRTTIKQERMTTKHQRMMAASEITLTSHEVAAGMVMGRSLGQRHASRDLRAVTGP